MSLNRLFDRALEVGQQTLTYTPRQRLAERAEELNRAGTMQAQLDVCVAAMVALVNILYRTDGDGRLANVDECTGRILVPVPWGNRGWRRWHMRRWEADCLRSVLIEQGMARSVSLFDYSPETRQWYLDRDIFPTMESALQWLKEHAPTLADWRPVVDAYRQREQERMRARRSS